MNIGNIILMLAVVVLASCGNGKKQSTDIENDSLKTVSVTLPDSVIESKIVPSYAEGFRVTVMRKGVKLVEIRDPQSTWEGSYKFALVSSDADKSDIDPSYSIIPIPVSKVLCMTTLQLSNFIRLNAIDKVTGITSSRYLFNEDVNRRIDEGKIMRIGIEGNFDNETIIATNPDIILISPFKRGGYAALQDVGIPLIPHLGYKEISPLGQAEWIKFVGMLTGDESTAIIEFDKIASRYNHLRTLAAEQKERPMVLSGEMRGGNWYAVGGKSFLAMLFRDAGADYFLKNDSTSGGKNLDYETVYSQAVHARYWRIVNSHDGAYSYDVLRESDVRYTDFDAFKNKGVIYCNMREKPFYETMPVEPDEVLADLIAVFHPSLLPEHKAKYYELLK